MFPGTSQQPRILGGGGHCPRGNPQDSGGRSKKASSGRISSVLSRMSQVKGTSSQQVSVTPLAVGPGTRSVASLNLSFCIFPGEGRGCWQRRHSTYPTTAVEIWTSALSWASPGLALSQEMTLRLTSEKRRAESHSLNCIPQICKLPCIPTCSLFSLVWH